MTRKRAAALYAAATANGEQDYFFALMADVDRIPQAETITGVYRDEIIRRHRMHVNRLADPEYAYGYFRFLTGTGTAATVHAALTGYSSLLTTSDPLPLRLVTGRHTYELTLRELPTVGDIYVTEPEHDDHFDIHTIRRLQVRDGVYIATCDTITVPLPGRCDRPDRDAILRGTAPAGRTRLSTTIRKHYDQNPNAH